MRGCGSANESISNETIILMINEASLSITATLKRPCLVLLKINPLSANITKWSNTLRQFRRIVGVCLTILWDWHLKG